MDLGGRINYAPTDTLNGYKRWTPKKDKILIRIYEQPNKTYSIKKKELIAEFQRKNLWSLISYSSALARYYKLRNAIKLTQQEYNLL